ncbi:MAG: hypothetical protein VYA51_06195 [Planctomycetota bacterium]|nr:hypothetical protein [Planctomycetota bacterium]
MFVAASLSLFLAAIPQQQGEQKPILSARDQKSLADKLKKYLAAEIAYDNAEGRAREKAGKTRRKAKSSFNDAWENAEKKGELLGSMADLNAIYNNCFTPGKPSHGKGKIYPQSMGSGSDLKWGIFVPKKYREKNPWPAIVALPDGAAGKWAKPAAHFKATWEGSGMMATHVVHIPMIPEGLELDPIPDYSREGAEVDENNRNRTVLGTLGYVLNNYNIERDKVFLDCGKESCGYGMRLASLFPDRFAGVILRDAVAIDGIRLGALSNLPILMLKSDANGAAVDALKARLDEACPGMATVIDAKGASPHLDSAADILSWMGEQRRVMAPTKVVLEPNHDRFKKAYWVNIHVAESLLTTTGDDQPRMTVEADREQNRITVEATSVERFELLLNDTLVDLSKEFTVVVNGKAVQEKRRRSFRDMHSRMMTRNDWGYLFPVRYVTTVPKPAEEKGAEDKAPK